MGKAGAALISVLSGLGVFAFYALLSEGDWPVAVGVGTGAAVGSALFVKQMGPRG